VGVSRGICRKAWARASIWSHPWLFGLTDLAALRRGLHSLIGNRSLTRAGRPKRIFDHSKVVQSALVVVVAAGVLWTFQTKEHVSWRNERKTNQCEKSIAISLTLAWRALVSGVYVVAYGAARSKVPL
jgi:hypothetical protein